MIESNMHTSRKVEYIIVGLGIAGISFCEQLRRNNKSFVVFDSGETSSTLVSGGVFNPLVLKRFTKCWNADNFLEYAIPFYERLSLDLQSEVFSKTPILRILSGIEEQNNWIVASDKKSMSPYMLQDYIENDNPNIMASYGYGKVLSTGQVDPKKMKKLYSEILLIAKNLYIETFDYDQVIESKGQIGYKGIQAKNLVFSEGAAAIKNPYFPKDFLIGNKGEYIIIKSPDLKLKEILKGPLFVIPLGDSLYKIGATFSNNNVSLNTTISAKEELLEKLEYMIRCDYIVVDQIAGIRPTSRDRRPLIGKLTADSKIAFMNGLGTRGILMAPLLGKMLYENLENNTPFPNEINIVRFMDC